MKRKMKFLPGDLLHPVHHTYVTRDHLGRWRNVTSWHSTGSPVIFIYLNEQVVEDVLMYLLLTSWGHVSLVNAADAMKATL